MCRKALRAQRKQASCFTSKCSKCWNCGIFDYIRSAKYGMNKWNGCIKILPSREGEGVRWLEWNGKMKLAHSSFEVSDCDEKRFAC